MKLYLAATAVVALAKHASAFKIVQDFDGNFCIMVVKYDGTASAWGTNAITATPSASTDPNGVGPTVGPNGVNDPLGAIKNAATTAWDAWITANPSFTVYEAGGATALSPQPVFAAKSGTLDWCKMYSTSAPDHYCKGDGDYANWNAGTKYASIAECCTKNHPTEYNACYETSAGVPPMSELKWYAKYDGGKCVRSCDTDNLFNPSDNDAKHTNAATTLQYECGGFTTWTGQTTYPNSDTGLGSCCSAAFGSLQPNYCKFLSTVGSASSASPYPGSSWDPADAASWVAGSWTTAAQYPGDQAIKWYADTSNSICKQDCIVGRTVPAGLQCGGVVTAASTTLYDDANACCASMPWVSACKTRSEAGQGNPTDLFWDSQDGCREDCAASNGANCVAAPSTAKLYPDATTCCKNANSWLNLKYCVSRANKDFDESVPTSTGTNEWYVSYEDGVCRQDCGNGGAAPHCEFAQSGGLTFFSSAEDCCKGTLASNDLEACIQGSTEGKSITTVETARWYVSTGGSGGDQPCAQDCATGTACGGVVAKTGVRLYDTATDCCKQAYSWMNQDLCQKLSANADEPTNMWYVDYGADACVQDCETKDGTTCLNPHGRPDDHSTPLYASADACCKAKLNWIKPEICKVASESGIDPADGDSPGAGAWRKNNAWSYCVLDCVEGDAIATGAPIITVQPLSSYIPSLVFVAGTSNGVTDTYPEQCDGVTSDSSATQYGASVENCCKSISWVQADTCKALSTGVKSQKFFQDPSDSNKCVVHQVASTTGIIPTPTIQCGTVGTVSGVVTGTLGTEPTGVKCEPDIQPATKLYATLDACCKANVPWDSDNCKYSSMGTSSPGTGNWYIDWSVEKCAQDCPETTTAGSTCGGIANKWQVLYSSSSACCKQISWISAAKCVFYQT